MPASRPTALTTTSKATIQAENPTPLIDHEHRPHLIHHARPRRLVTLIQCDHPRRIWNSPADAGVAALFGGINRFPGSQSSQPLYLRPDQLRLCPLNASCIASGKVERVEFLGGSQLVLLRIPDSEPLIRVRVPPDHAVTLGSEHGIESLTPKESP